MSPHHKEVWKYRIKIEPNQTIEMPFGSQILSFQTQYGIPSIWVLSNPEAEMISRNFRLVGTGHKIEEGGLQYIGTVQLLEGEIVYHLFEH